MANHEHFLLDSPSPLLMTKDLLLAIDVGTGSARAALVSQSGKIIAFAAKEHSQIIPRFGWSQQSPRTWWEGVVFSIRSVLGEVPDAADRIEGIATCGQMHATVLLGDAGELALEEVPLWNDKRTRELVIRFLQEHDPEALISMTANPPTVAWPAFKLAWIKQNAPKAYAAARTFLTPKDYINFKLTGERRIDFCEASCSYMFDLRSRAWSDKILRLLDLDPDKLPPLSAASELLGLVTNEAARTHRLAGRHAGGGRCRGLCRGTPWCGCDETWSGMRHYGYLNAHRTAFGTSGVRPGDLQPILRYWWVGSLHDCRCGWRRDALGAQAVT